MRLAVPSLASLAAAQLTPLPASPAKAAVPAGALWADQVRVEGGAGWMLRAHPQLGALLRSEEE